jgi:DNA-binding transcriptional ArsR family regulator
MEHKKAKVADLVFTKSSNTKEQIIIDAHQLKKSTEVLRALNHKLRHSILKLIEENKKIHVTQVYAKLKIEQSVASQHLAILRSANIVITEREGKFIFYTINKQRLAEISEIIKLLSV